MKTKVIRWTESEHAAYAGELRALAPRGLTIVETAQVAMERMKRPRPLASNLLRDAGILVKQARDEAARAPKPATQTNGAAAQKPAAPPPIKHRIAWTTREESEFRAHVLREWLALPDVVRAKVPAAQIAVAALAHFPPERRRTICHALTKPVLAWLDAWRKTPPAAPPPLPGAAPTATVTPIGAKPSAANPFPNAPLPPLNGIPRRRASDKLAAVDDEAPASFVDRAHVEAVAFGVSLLAEILRAPAVREAIAGLARVAVGKAESAAADSTVQWQTNAALPQTKVLVAGLRGHQLTAVHDAFKGKLNLRFWENGKSYAQLKHDAKMADAVIGITKFLPHSADALCKGNAARYIRHAGGMSTLADVLAALAAA